MCSSDLFPVTIRAGFTVSRAIYKGILKYLSFNSGTEYVVQPLPIEGFSTRFVARNKVELKWIPVHDSIEPTAKPDKYIVYTRIDDGGFNNGVISEKNSIVVGKNKGWKNEINNGAKNNRTMYNFPHAKFIEILKYKALLKDIIS